MNTRTLTRSVLFAAASLLATGSAFAGAIPYPNKGTVAPTTTVIASSNNGVGVDLYYYGSDALYTEGIQVWDTSNGYKSNEIFINHASVPGSETMVGAGHINQGDTIVFVVDSPVGVQYTSDPSLSSDGMNHVYITNYNGGTLNGVSVPPGLFLGFEDQPISSSGKQTSDLDYNDVEVISTGVTTVTPEPSSLALLGTGVLGIAGVLKRRVAA